MIRINAQKARDENNYIKFICGNSLNGKRNEQMSLFTKCWFAHFECTVFELQMVASASFILGNTDKTNLFLSLPFVFAFRSSCCVREHLTTHINYGKLIEVYQFYRI